MRLVLLISLFISFSIFAGVKFLGLSIVESDNQLKANGWEPIPLQCEYEEEKELLWSANDASDIYNAGITSIHHCFGTEKNSCSFFYEKVKLNNGKINKDCLKLVTSGEFSHKGLNSLIVVQVFEHCPEEC